MEEKPQSVFEILDSQSEQIEDISKKLEGVSVNDLYALAKRTWDYGDFNTAQKYYNHISLLRPLDWEAPLYASLCNFKGYHDMNFWSLTPIQEEPIIIATIRYINNLDTDVNEKEKELNKCVDILIEYLEKEKSHYYKYQKEYEDVKADYVYDLQNLFLNIYEKIDDIPLKNIRRLQTSLADMCLEIVGSTNMMTPKIDEQLFKKLVDSSSKDWGVGFEDLFNKSAKPKSVTIDFINTLPKEKKNEVLLTATVYYEFKDKVVGKRVGISRLVYGLIIALVSVGGIVVSSFSSPLFMLPFIASLILSIWIIVLAFIEKERINCSSYFSCMRKKARLTSSNSVVIEGKMSLFRLLFALTMIFSGAMAIVIPIVLFTGNNHIELSIKISSTIFIAVSAFAQYLCFLKGVDGIFGGELVFKAKGEHLE